MAGQDLVSPADHSVHRGVFALLVTSGIAGNFQMRWDNNDNSGKTLRGICFNECSYPGKQVLLWSCG